MSMNSSKSGVRRTREELSSTSSTESSLVSPQAKSQKMAEHKEPVTIDTLFAILMEVQKNTSALLEDNNALRKDIDEAKGGLSMQNTLVEELRKENKHLKTEVQELRKASDACLLQINLLQCKLEQAENKGDDLEMYTRKSSLEIHGVPEAKEEDLDTVVVQVADHVGVEIEENDIDIVHRLPVKVNDIRPIIVKFKSHKVKSQIYFARRRLRGTELDRDVLNGAEQIYINENLTAQKRRLFAETRKRAKQHKWHKVWTVDGKIFVCQEKGDRSIKISSYTELEDIYV